jgi:ABC-type multidrug transport system fused ATPase/permease subunit
MRNFFRLARFAWPYRVRFFLSIICAVMVALFWFTNLGSVYFLLQILLHSQNCQKWVAEEIVTTQMSLDAGKARLDMLSTVDRLARPVPDLAALTALLEETGATWERESIVLRERQRAYDDAVSDDPDGPLVAAARDSLQEQRQLASIAQARYEELNFALPRAKTHDEAGLATRVAAHNRDQAKGLRWYNTIRWAQPWIVRYLPDDGFHTLLLLICIVMCCVAIKGVFMFCQEVLVADINQLVLFDIRNLFFRRTLALDMGRFNEKGSAELMARFTNDMDSVAQGLSTIMSKVVREPLRIFTCLAGAFWFNWRLTCLTLVLVPISAMTTVRVGKIMKRAVRKSLESMSNIYKILQETFQGIKVVKAFTMERRERRRFFLETKSLYRKSVRVAMIDAMSDPVLEMLSLMTVAIALLAGSYLVLRQTLFLDLGLFKLQLASRPMQIEDLLTLYTMLAGVSDPIRKLSNVHSKVQRAAAASDRICGLMDRTPEVVEKPHAARLAGPAHRVAFEQVWFSYNGRDHVLRGVDLEVRQGETVAIVGPNGCGKSTMLNLLPRFWDVQSGTIRVDGKDIRELNIRSLRKKIGMVTQETILFESTVAENIAYGSPTATRAQIEDAARRAYAHAFILGLPKGYETVLGERGSSLSGGQRQRLALARAMLRDPSILILDEATSAVDIQDEALLRRAIEDFARGRTTFLITHNLGSLQFADRIVLMNAGRIEAVGTEADLRRSSSLYRRLHEIHYQRESA